MKTGFWEQRKFFDAYGSRENEQLAKLPPRGMRVTCPCCGYPTMLGGYEICGLCDWEDDGQDDIDASEIRGGPNAGYSLVAARQNFETYLTMYTPEEDRRVGGPDSERERQIKLSILAAYDQMMSEPPPDELNALWQVVTEGERALDQELKRRVFGPLYEAVPCPYCGERLRTILAKQCRKCGMDWHDPDKVIRLPGF